MEKKNISISKKARYFQLGKISEQTKTIWFVFHGYGMLSQYFIKKFKSLERDKEIETPTINKKNGKTRSVGVAPFHSACLNGA